MPRSPAGVYSLPAGNPVSTGQVISSTLWNTTFGDIATALTESLGTSGAAAMTQPLRLDDGTVALPGLTFDSEQTSGLYRAGTNDVRMAIAGVEAMRWTASGATIAGAISGAGGITATQSTANAAAGTFTGNGTGAGVVSTGGSTSGPGGAFTGGAPNGAGSTFTGTGTGAGATFTGGATSGPGVIATGGAGGGNGITASATAGNARGGEFTGHGTGRGAYGIGGSTSGTGIFGTGGAPDGTGAKGAGTGAGAGGEFTGGSTDGLGVIGIGGGGAAGGQFTSGTAQTATVAQSAVKLTNGNLSMVGVTNPNKDVAFSNTLTPRNIVKAWASITTNSSASPTYNSGFNVSGVTAGASDLTFTFASGMSGAKDYSATVTCSWIASNNVVVAAVDTSSASQVVVRIWSLVTTPSIVARNPSATSGDTINLLVCGVQ